MSRKLAGIFVTALGLAALPALTHAAPTPGALNAVDPGPYTAATGYFPLWYEDNQDKLELCLSKAVNPAGLPLCTLLPDPGVFDPNQPVVFPTNFPGESFWFIAEASFPAQNGITLEVYVAAMEAAFAGDVPKQGDQVSFARIRIRAGVTTPGQYVITHPYGVEQITVTQADIDARGGSRAINLTRDVGIGAPGDYTGALNGDIGPFLRSVNAPISAINPETGAQETFIGDPNVLQQVTGGRNDVNYVRIDGPTGSAQTELFSLSGKVLQPHEPTPVAVERATYSRNAQGTRIEVFASSTPNATVCFRESIELVQGTPPSPCLLPMQADGNGGFFAHDPNPATLPPVVVVTAVETPKTPTSLAGTLTDLVKIPTAHYARDTGTLTIEATSSDEVVIPDLAVVGFGRMDRFDGPVQRLVVSDLAQAPASITVKSAAGGSHTEPVVIAATANTGNVAPVANPDIATVAQGASVIINVLDNDSDEDGNLPLTVIDVSQPTTGSASTDGTTVTYTAPAGFAGIATFSYRVSDALGELSVPAIVTMTITNQAPTAVNDSASTTAGQVVSIPVLNNDSDADGNTPLAVTNLTQPAAGQGSVATDGTTVFYTPPGTLTTPLTTSFTYQARDQLNALSAVTTVTVQVASNVVAENLVVTSATVSRTGTVANPRYTWRFAGTTDRRTGNTVTVLVNSGPNSSLVQIGTATPNRNNGSWTVTATNSRIVPAPSPQATIRTTAGSERTVLVQ